jgi:uncharacterized protein YjbI with pentapeptide repeats
VNLSAVDLSEVDLTRANLRAVNLSEANLSGAKLSGAKKNRSLRLTFQYVAFNMLKAIFKFSILLQLCFYADNRTADRTVPVHPKSRTNSHQRI